MAKNILSFIVKDEGFFFAFSAVVNTNNKKTG